MIADGGGSDSSQDTGKRGGMCSSGGEQKPEMVLGLCESVSEEPKKEESTSGYDV